MSRRSALGAAVAVLATAVLLLPTAATAHGLLQVEVLTHQDVFVPPWAVGGRYALAPSLERGLSRRLRRQRAAGDPTKVVLIAQRVDLQDVGMYFEFPDAYASFLGELLASLRIFDGRLIVVMPSGVAEATGGASAHMLGVPRPAMRNEWDVDALARTAIRVMDHSPRGDATTLRSPALQATHLHSASRRSDQRLWVGLALVLAAAGGLLVFARLRPNHHARSQPQ
jgi:hypothetical protein